MTVRPARGFTLLELLVAIGITAALAAMVAGSFARLDRIAEEARAQQERLGTARLALSRMAREIRMAFVSDQFDATRYRERPTLFVGREDDLLFTTFAHERLWKDAKESDQAVVEYALDRDPDAPGEEALFRREKVHLDDDPERGGARDVACPRVERIRFQYWDRRRGEWTREWSTRTTERANDLPTRVRIELELKVPGGETEKLSTEARIALTRPLDTR
ncbi:MAG TPA: type II secretion system protein GspJ [Anaeromyxobacteraceae bacterium]|nr:type II secretion system protein GspJ [Anaeromyxobacteraceae bacterium]